MSMLLVGDVHEDNANLDSVHGVDKVAPTPKGKAPVPFICVGDLGFDYKKIKVPSRPFMFIDGNHDHFEKFDCNGTELQVLDNGIVYIPRGYINENGVLFIGGAESIDKHSRIRGLSWWPQEQITYDQMARILADPRLKTVHTVVSHCAPTEIAKKIIEGMTLKLGQASHMEFYGSTSENMLENLLEQGDFHPKRWYFGHYHVNWEREYGDCRFRCIAPGSVVLAENPE